MVWLETEEKGYMTCKKLYEWKLMHRFSVWLDYEEELNRVESRQRSLEEEIELHICEPEQGVMLGE